MLVLVEESYKITAWCREILDGLRLEARKKRVNLVFSSNIEDVNGETEERAVMIVGSESEWLSYTVKRIRSAGKHPIILSNQSENVFGGSFSCVTVDLRESMREIYGYLLGKGCKSIALYAVNPSSVSDICRRDTFLACGGHSRDSFTNEGSLESCFNSFYERYRQAPYDGVICTNDFAAISLIRHMKEKEEQIEGLYIISYSNTLISSCFSPSVSSVTTNYQSFGKLAFMISDCLAKSADISGIHLHGKWEIIHKETSSPLGETASSIDHNPDRAIISTPFYDDPEIIEMVRIENLLSECDKTDLEIISMILEGKKTTEIYGACFLTETAIKYRMKKIKEACHVSSRAEVKEILCQYLNDQSSLSFLIEDAERI